MWNTIKHDINSKTKDARGTSLPWSVIKRYMTGLSISNIFITTDDPGCAVVIFFKILFTDDVAKNSLLHSHFCDIITIHGTTSFSSGTDVLYHTYLCGSHYLTLPWGEGDLANPIFVKGRPMVSFGTHVLTYVCFAQSQLLHWGNPLRAIPLFLWMFVWYFNESKHVVSVFRNTYFTEYATTMAFRLFLIYYSGAIPRRMINICLCPETNKTCIYMLCRLHAICQQLNRGASISFVAN